MTPDFPTLRARLGLTTGAVARLCGVDVRTAQRWVAERQPVPPPALRLLWLCATVPGALEVLGEYSPRRPPEAR